MKQGIYAIVNLVSGKRYIGSSVDIDRRFAGHVRQLSQERHHNVYLQRAWLKYGPVAFALEILEVILDRELLAQRENDYIAATAKDQLYNVAPDASRPPGCLGPMPDWHKAKIAAAKLGKAMTETTRNRVSDGIRRWWLNQENRRRISASFKLKRATPETKRKLSLSHKRVWSDPGYRERMSKVHLGRVGPNRGKRMSPEQKAKISASLKVTFAEKRALECSSDG